MVGPWHLREFSLARQEIDPTSVWPTCQTLEQAADILEKQTKSPELLLLAQPRPGYYAQAILEHLQQMAPITRIVIVAGSWCEGELRTGQPAQGVIRLYWYDLAAWWQEAMVCQTAGVCPSWSEPLDDGYTQRLRTHSRQPQADLSQSSQMRTDILVEIDTIQHETFATLAAVLATAGWPAVWQRRSLRPTSTRGTTSGIWDGGQLDPPEVGQLARFSRSLNKNPKIQIPVLVLLDFPRSEHLALVKAAGANAILPKPYRMDDLLSWVVRSEE
jgi:hypothetical protein